MITNEFGLLVEAEGLQGTVLAEVLDLAMKIHLESGLLEAQQLFLEGKSQ